MVFSIKFMTSCDISNILRQFIIQLCRSMSYASGQSRPYLDISVWSRSHLGCVHLCKVILLCLWILCSILSDRQGTICGYLVSRIALFLLLVFATSSVGMLWVWNCFGRSLCLGLFFFINVVLLLVIHSGTCALCRHLFISNNSLSWMEVNFLNQKPFIPLWPGAFQFDIF